MKNLAAILFALVLATPGVFAEQEQEEQEQDSELASLLSDFGRLAEADDVTLTLIYLNDRTVEALFAAPRKYAFRAQARQRPLFLAQGIAHSALDVNLEFSAEQDGAVIPGQTYDIANFAGAATLSEGDRFGGLVALEGQIDVSKPFTIVNGDLRFDFDLPEPPD